MDAAKAHQHGQLLGPGGYCYGLFFSLPLAPLSRHVNSIATLELMALVAAIATFTLSSATFLVWCSSRNPSLPPSTSRTTRLRMTRLSAHLSTCTPCLLLSPPSRSFMWVTSLAQPIRWLMHAAVAAFRSSKPSARASVCSPNALTC
eukprot:6199471-Pleurochrysis_carterae.AAC.1